MPYAIKASIPDPAAPRFHFIAHKTMYAGKTVTRGDIIFIFASESAGGSGLVARGTVQSAEPVPRIPGVVRQTPRVTLVVERVASAKRPLGRTEIRSFEAWNDGRPETELNFKFYRQATDKLVRLSDAASQFLDAFF